MDSVQAMITRGYDRQITDLETAITDLCVNNKYSSVEVLSAVDTLPFILNKIRSDVRNSKTSNQDKVALTVKIDSIEMSG